jgi:hypothetical protein
VFLGRPEHETAAETRRTRRVSPPAPDMSEEPPPSNRMRRTRGRLCCAHAPPTRRDFFGNVVLDKWTSSSRCRYFLRQYLRAPCLAWRARSGVFGRLGARTRRRGGTSRAWCVGWGGGGRDGAMGWFGPSAPDKSTRRRRELEEANGEGYDEAEELRIFALEGRAREENDLEEAFGEGYCAVEETRIFADLTKGAPVVPVAAQGGDEILVRGRVLQIEKSDDAAEGEPAVLVQSPRERGKDPSPSPSPSASPALQKIVQRWKTFSRWVPEPAEMVPEPAEAEPTARTVPEPPPPNPRTVPEPADPNLQPVSEPTEPNLPQNPLALATEATPTEKTPVPETAVQNEPEPKPPPQQAYLPPVADLGDPATYARLRETLGLDAALLTPLRELLEQLQLEETTEKAGDGGDRRIKVNPDCFVPTSMPPALLLPFAKHEAYGRLKLQKGKLEDGSVGYSTAKGVKAKPG